MEPANILIRSRLIYFLALATLALLQCKPSHNQASADLQKLSLPGINKEIERLEAKEAGGQNRRRFKAMEMHQMEIGRTDPLQLHIKGMSASLEITPELIELPDDWYDYAELIMELSPEIDCQIRLSVVHVNGFLPLQETLKGGKTSVIKLSLRDLPLASANETPYLAMGIRLEVLKAKRIPFSLHINRIALMSAKNVYRRTVVDRFGQRITTSWPGKVKKIADLQEDRVKETLTPPPANRCRFGGWMEGPVHRASGFFRVEQSADSTWWFIDPEGHRFWSAGITCVNIGSDVTATAGREFLYEDYNNLPLNNDAKKSINYFAWNVDRKYDSLEQWRVRTLARLQSWGMNTIGNWSSPAMMRPGEVVYTTSLSTRTDDAPMAGHRLPDVFDQRWEHWFDSTTAKQVAKYKEDRWLLGYFVDNELPWLHLKLLDAGENTAVKKAWQQFVIKTVGKFDSASSIWPKIHHRDDLLGLKEKDAETGLANQLKLGFEAHFAETYFLKVSQILKKHDPNHLYLGCRFVRNAPDASIMKAAGKYCDVVTVNCYSWEPKEEQFGDWYAQCKRPILIGEHHVTLQSPRQVPPPWKIFNADQRKIYYKNFVEVWARRNYSLGCHYFQLIDQPLTGRFDGENRTIGWLDITDQPHTDLVSAGREALPHIYTWHNQ